MRLPKLRDVRSGLQDARSGLQDARRRDTMTPLVQSRSFGA